MWNLAAGRKCLRRDRTGDVSYQLEGLYLQRAHLANLQVDMICACAALLNLIHVCCVAYCTS